MRKFMGEFETAQNYGDTPHDWPVFRYAEILLNYAEAQNEFVGPTAEVYDAIRAIRQRAGIQSGGGTYGLDAGLTQEQMRIIIRNERRIELAFEEHRSWDIRRWKIAEEVFSTPVNGVIIVKAGTQLNYNVVPVQDAAFDEKRYFYPISYDEVIKNGNMVQNPQW
jgi:hypothetical protein